MSDPHLEGLGDLVISPSTAVSHPNSLESYLTLSLLLSISPSTGTSLDFRSAFTSQDRLPP
jgi:hypothetical protein